MSRSPRTHLHFAHENQICYITTVLADRRDLFLNDDLCQIVWDNIFFYGREYQVDIIAFVIMPDHVHLLVWPKGDRTFSEFMNGVKSYSARQILEYYGIRRAQIAETRRPQGRPPMGETKYPSVPQSSKRFLVWQPSFFPYLISDVDKLQEKLDYIRLNPVEAGLTTTPEEYRWLYVNPEIDAIQL